MIVFKCYMKILRQNVTLVIIYLGIFFSVALVMQMAAGKSEDSLYANTSIDIGVVKEDQGVLAQGFVDYLNTIHNVIPMKNNPEVLQENFTVMWSILCRFLMTFTRLAFKEISH